jgi:hypothetical protein
VVARKAPFCPRALTVTSRHAGLVTHAADAVLMKVRRLVLR